MRQRTIERPLRKELGLKELLRTLCNDKHSQESLIQAALFQTMHLLQIETIYQKDLKKFPRPLEKVQQKQPSFDLPHFDEQHAFISYVLRCSTCAQQPYENGTAETYMMPLHH